MPPRRSSRSAAPPSPAVPSTPLTQSRRSHSMLMNSDSPKLKSQPAPAIPSDILPSSLADVFSDSVFTSNTDSVLYENGHYSSRSAAAFALVQATGAAESGNCLQNLGGFISSAIYRHNLETALYMLDPWEKILFNSITASMTVGALYLTWNFIQTGTLI